MKRKIKLFLASRSPRRKELLRRLGLPFRVVRSAFRERIKGNLGPSENARWNAEGKARMARVREPYGWVIGADTFIYFRGKVIGKPHSIRDARNTLAKLSGKIHFVYTGIAIHDLARKTVRTSYAKSKVRFRALSPGFIRRYVAHWKPLDKAGSYAVQDDGHALIRSVKGSLSNVIGLPMELLIDELSHAIKSTRSVSRSG